MIGHIRGGPGGQVKVTLQPAREGLDGGEVARFMAHYRHLLWEVSMDVQLNYEEIPYPAYVHPQTHPAHIAGIARLCGHTPPEVESARVLELGCGPGANLLAMAEWLPGAEFVGLDLAATHIETARQNADLLGLRNVQFFQRDLLQPTTDLGSFDYILAHGLYSWVPPAVQARVLEVCGHQLKPGGVVFVSYNCLPGWHLRKVMFDLMRLPAEGSPRERLEQGRHLVNVLAQGVRSRSPAWGHLMREERRFLKESDDDYLVHEYLVDHMEPLYFKTFMERARQAGLEFMAEADEARWLLPGAIPELVELGIDPLADPVETQQMVDFFLGRTFRQTLLVARDTPTHLPSPRGLAGQYVAARLKIHDEDLGRVAGPLRFKTHRGESMVEHREEVVKVLRHLALSWPAMVQVETLLHIAQGENHSEGVGDLVRGAVLMGYLDGWIEVKSWNPPISPTLPAKPHISPAVALGLKVGGAANLRHEWVELEGKWVKLIPHLDGNHTPSQLRDLSGLSTAEVDEGLRYLHRASFFHR